MKIDKSKMTQEEQATLAEFEKKYGIAEPAEGGGTPPADPAPAGGVEKHAETPAAPEQPAVPAGGTLHPDVAKALSDFEAMKKQQTAEIEALKKSLEVERLTALIRRYPHAGLCTAPADYLVAAGTRPRSILPWIVRPWIGPDLPDEAWCPPEAAAALMRAYSALS